MVCQLVVNLIRQRGGVIQPVFLLNDGRLVFFFRDGGVPVGDFAAVTRVKAHFEVGAVG